MVDPDEHQFSKRRAHRTELTRPLLLVASQQQNRLLSAAGYLGTETENGMNRVGQCGGRKVGSKT